MRTNDACNSTVSTASITTAAGRPSTAATVTTATVTTAITVPTVPVVATMAEPASVVASPTASDEHAAVPWRIVVGVGGDIARVIELRVAVTRGDGTSGEAENRDN
jgi:hypothetical protein